MDPYHINLDQHQSAIVMPPPFPHVQAQTDHTWLSMQAVDRHISAYVRC
jgi:hypothetical protein